MACLLGHKWNGCKCEKCGKTRDMQHKWLGCVCESCGKQTTYVDLSILESEEIKTLNTCITDNADTVTVADDVREFQSRIIEAEKMRPFKLIKEDFVIVISIMEALYERYSPRFQITEAIFAGLNSNPNIDSDFFEINKEKNAKAMEELELKRNMEECIQKLKKLVQISG